MVNVHFIGFADTALLHTENDNFHHLLFYNELPNACTTMHLLVDFVYTFRNFVNVYQQKTKRCRLHV